MYALYADLQTNTSLYTCYCYIYVTYIYLFYPEGVFDRYLYKNACVYGFVSLKSFIQGVFSFESAKYIR